LPAPEEVSAELIDCLLVKAGGSRCNHFNWLLSVLLLQWCQVLDTVLGALGVIKEIKGSCDDRHF
jgi:hypothetical protein